MFVGMKSINKKEEQIITVDRKTLELWSECLMKIDWECSNQTMKILKRLYYEKAGMSELFTWIDEEGTGPQHWESDMGKYSEAVKMIIVNIAIYLSAFDKPEFIEHMKALSLIHI